MKIQILITGLVLAFSTLFMESGKTTSLMGKIQDHSGMGIVFGSLEIYTNDAEHKLIYSGETNLNGEFVLNDLVPGIYEMIIKAPGFEDKIQTLHLTSEVKNMGAISLDGNVITLDTAIIYGKPSATI